MPNSSTLHIPPANLLLLAAKPEPYKKSLSLSVKISKNVLENVQEAEKDKTERVTGLGRKTREEIVKWN